MSRSIHFFAIKNLLTLLLLLFTFLSPLTAYDDGDDDVDDEWETTSCYSRYAFPATCEEHFGNNIATTHTWMEAEDRETICLFSDYLKIIPKIYEADCYPCYDCGGVNFCIYRGCDFPTDIAAYEELMKCHEKSRQGWRSTWCIDKNDQSYHCESTCWNGGYFRLWNQKYLHFFKHFLQYCSDNTECECYWPECEQEAININNCVYKLCRDLAEDGLINPEFSLFWRAQGIGFDHNGKIYGEGYYPNAGGMASSLTTYTFFYSQYHQMLLSIAEFIDSNEIYGNSEALDRIYSTLDAIRSKCLKQYNACIRFHAHPKIFYERGMLRMHSGMIEDALMDINRLMRMAKTDRYKDKIILTSDMYQQEGELYADLGKYDNAISSLSEAIRIDPNNRGAYFSRAQAYFETGGFEQSLNDYLASKTHSGEDNTKLKPSWDVKESMLKGLKDGCTESLANFVPSLCSSVYGLCSSAWVFANHPIRSTTNFVNACYDVGNCFNECRKNVDNEDIESFPLEIQRLWNRYERLSEPERGYLIAYIVGSGGVDVFAGGSAVKSISAFKKLRDTNRACMLETMAVSASNKEAMIASALKHQTQREAFFKNVKLHVDRQNKHVPGKHNYQVGKSILEHPDSKGLLEKFAGKGRPLKNRVPGLPDYREKVDFGEFIGYHINEITKAKTPTTYGEIRHSKNGAHIVPALPD